MKEHLSELQKLVVEAASEKKATDIVILDLRNHTDFTDFFLICGIKGDFLCSQANLLILEASY